MNHFKLDLLALTHAARKHVGMARFDGAAEEREAEAAVRDLCAELAAQLRPHVPGAREGDGLEELLGKLIAAAEYPEAGVLMHEAQIAVRAAGMTPPPEVRPLLHILYTMGARREGRR